MNLQVLEIIERIKTGKIPYRYEFDVQSGIYFALAIVAVIFIYAFAQAATSRLLS